MSSANAFNLDMSKILSFGKEFNIVLQSYESNKTASLNPPTNGFTKFRITVDKSQDVSSMNVTIRILGCFERGKHAVILTLEKMPVN